MSDSRQYDTLQLVGFHEPDVNVERSSDGTVTRTELPGLYTYGFKIGDTFIRLGRMKAPRVAAAKQKLADAAAAEQSSSSSSG